MGDLNEIHKQARKQTEELKQQYLEEHEYNNNQCQTEDYGESPYTMENGTATFLYIVIMAIGTLFVDRWLIYITATFIYISFRNRHKKKK